MNAAQRLEIYHNSVTIEFWTAIGIVMVGHSFPAEEVQGQIEQNSPLASLTVWF